MTQTIPTQGRINRDVKTKTVKMFNKLGLDMSSVINIFLNQCIINDGLPFIVTTKKNNKLRDLKEDAYEVHNSKTIKGYHNVKFPKYEQLSYEQKSVSALNFDSNNIIIGAPGTGKTIVALHRMNYLYENAYKKFRNTIESFNKNNDNNVENNNEDITDSKLWNEISDMKGHDLLDGSYILVIAASNVSSQECLKRATSYGYVERALEEVGNYEKM